MAGKPSIRDVNPILQRIRNWLLSHDEFKPTHRVEGYIAKRTQPQPNMPPGVSSSLSNNYYYTRDGRRESEPPVKVFVASQKLIEGKETVPQKPVIPGFGYDWSTGKQKLGKSS